MGIPDAVAASAERYTLNGNDCIDFAMKVAQIIKPAGRFPRAGRPIRHWAIYRSSSLPPLELSRIELAGRSDPRLPPLCIGVGGDPPVSGRAYAGTDKSWRSH
ncbi:hypothetical protein ACRAWD_02570 [Caulobacter segnis]